jgi:uncharacterized protein YkwD
MLVFKFSNKAKTSFHLSCIVAILMLTTACVRDSLLVTKLESPPKPQVTESTLFSEDAISSPYTQFGLSNARCDLQDVDSFQIQFVDTLNQLRATEQVCGREKMPASLPLVWSTRLQMSAYEHSAQMAVTNLVSHISLDSRRVGDRVKATGYRYRVVGENIAAGQTDVAAAIRSWLHSPPHCKQMLSAEFTEFAVACVTKRNSFFKNYWTMNLARPMF